MESRYEDTACWINISLRRAITQPTKTIREILHKTNKNNQQEKSPSDVNGNNCAQDNFSEANGIGENEENGVTAVDEVEVINEIYGVIDHETTEEIFGAEKKPTQKKVRFNLSESEERRSKDDMCGNVTRKEKQSTFRRSKSCRYRTSRTVAPKTESYLKLREELNGNAQAMKQASTALLLSKSTNFTDLTAEAEKILLISSTKHKRILDTIRQNLFDAPKQMTSHGTITITNLKFEAEANAKETNFICIISCGTDVISTDISEVNQGYVSFPDTIVLEEVPVDFAIDIQIYSLPVRPRRSSFRRFSFEPPQHQTVYLKDQVTAAILAADVQRSSYVLCGSFSVTMKHIDTSCVYYLLKPTGTQTCIKSHASCSVSVTDVVFPPVDIGFVNLGRRPRELIQWEHTWCAVRGTHMKFFAYPTDDDDTGRMIDAVDLRDVRLMEVKRERCTRSKCLVLVRMETMEELYLNAVSWEELEEWRKKIEEALEQLRKWDMVKIRDEEVE